MLDLTKHRCTLKNMYITSDVRLDKAQMYPAEYVHNK